MKEYVASYKQTIKAEVDFELDIVPEDYLHCESEDEVRNEVNLFLEENIDSGEYEINEILSSESTIPEDFFKEWRSLRDDLSRS